ncbi:MAG: LacI family DNA-binding transcriptional regulator [Rikenellaceae bacterium]
MKNKITIKDLAKQLGVSISTISRALSNKSDVNKETRDKVLKLAAEMGYRPNPIALNLRNKRSRTIGIVVPEFVNSFFTFIIMAVQEVLDQNGYQLLITQSNESAETEACNLRMLQNNMVEGIMISPTKQGQNIDLYREIIDAGTPIVFFNRPCNDVEASKVIIDDFSMAFFATEHLIYEGRRKIAHLAGLESLELTSARKNGYLKALSKHNIPINHEIIVTTGILEERGYEEMTKLLDKGVDIDAVFAMCDPVAIGAMKAIKERGIKIPEQIAIVGFSESRSATLIEPNLTSVAQPLSLMGETVAKLLLKEIDARNNNQPVTYETIKLDAILNIRESSRSTKVGDTT